MKSISVSIPYLAGLVSNHIVNLTPHDIVSIPYLAGLVSNVHSKKKQIELFLSQSLI